MRYTEMRSITFYNTHLLAFSLCLYITSILSTGVVKFVWRCVSVVLAKQRQLLLYRLRFRPRANLTLSYSRSRSTPTVICTLNCPD